MPTVYIPAPLQALTAGRSSVRVAGATVRQLIDKLEKSYPGLRDRLVQEGRLRAGIAVAVDGRVSPQGLRERVGRSSEVHFVVAVGGG